MTIFGKKDSSLTVLCDIGSGSITASLVLYQKNVPPTFLYTINRSFAVADKPDSFKLVDNMLKALDELLLDAIQKGLENPKIKSFSKEISNVVVSFSSPWFMPKTKFVDIKEEKPFVVTEAYLKELTKKEEDLFKKEIKDLHENVQDEFEIIENSIVHIKVNGYVINRIVGQKVSSLSAYLCMSLVSKEVLDKVQRLIEKHTHLHAGNIVYHTFPVVSFSVTRDIFVGYQDFLLIDVTSEVTDLTLVSNDVLSKTTSIPTGRNFIIRQIAKEFSLPSEIAESDLYLFYNKKLDIETTEKIQNILVDIEKEWAIYLEKALEDLSPQLVLPTRVYLTSSQDVSDIYLDYLKLSKADATSGFRKSANIIKVEDKIFSGLYKNESHTLPNEFVCLLAIFWNKFAFK